MKSVKYSLKSANKISKKSEETNGKNVIVNVASAYGAEAAKGKSINFKVLIKCTNEKFNVINFPISMRIRDLKGLLEFITGIPYNLQRLSYLDDGELIDPKELQYYDIIDGAVILMDIWTIYRDLVKTVVNGIFSELLKQGVSKKVQWNSPTSEYMFTRDRVNYINERSGISLFIAAHRGNLELTKNLIQHGADLDYKSSFGRTPIMIAVVAEKIEIIDYLLEHNADVDICDVNGDSAVTVAKKFNNKLGQHRLTQFKWKKRTEEEMRLRKQAKNGEDSPIFNEGRLPHQVFDSSKKTWLKGNYMQMYMAQLVPQSEYSGNSLSAPKSIGAEVIRQHRQSRSSMELKQPDEPKLEENGSRSPIQTGLTFDKWLSQKLKAKRIEEKIKKTNEVQQTNPESNSTEMVKEEETQNEPDKNVWMKEYSTPKAKNENLDMYENAKSISKSYEDNASVLNNSIRSKFSDINNIYKGMSYEEWARVRDQFLRSHDMN